MVTVKLADGAMRRIMRTSANGTIVELAGTP